MTSRKTLALLVAIFLSQALVAGQQASQSPVATWTREFKDSIWVVNTSVSAEYGVRRDSDDLERGLTTLQSVDSIFPALLVLEGSPGRNANLIALHPNDGRILWQKAGIRLRTSRPFGTYTPITGTRGDAYYAHIMGSTVLLWVTNAKRSGFTACGAEDGLVALSIDDGRFLWCSAEPGSTAPTFVPIHEERTIVVWWTSDRGATMAAIDSRTGSTRWRIALPLDSGSGWMRFLTYVTALGAPAYARPPIHHDGRLLVLLGEAPRVGPLLRYPDQARLFMLDLASGAPQWEAPVSLPGQPILSWAFGRQNLFITTAREAAAYDLSSGRRVWTASHENAFELRVASAGERDVVLLEIGSNKWWTIGRRYGGNGLIALNGATGDVLWRVGDGYDLHSYDSVATTLLVGRDNVVSALHAETGEETFRIPGRLDKPPQWVQALDARRIVVQSANQAWAYDRGSGQMLFAEKVSNPRRGAASVIAVLATAWLPWVGIPGLIQGVWTMGIAAGVPIRLVGMQASGLGILSVDFLLDPVRTPTTGSESMYFATGTGGDARLVSVSASTGQQTTIGRFAWPPGENLLDRFHGRTYTVTNERISAYSFNTDEAVRPVIQVAAEMQAGTESLERAAAFARSSQVGVATREAAHGLRFLEAFTSRGVSSVDEIVARRAIGDWFALTLELKIGDVAVAAARAISEYEKAVGLLASPSSNPILEGWKLELEARLRAVRATRQ